MNLDAGNYSERTQAMFQSIYHAAAELGHGFIGSEHILLGVLQDGGRAAQTLKRFGVDVALVERYLRTYDRDAAETAGGTQTLQFTPEADRIFTLAENAVSQLDGNQVEPEDLLLAILQDCACAAARLLLSLELDLEKIKSELLSSEMALPMQTCAPESEPEHTSKAEDNVLKKFGHDLTADAMAGRLDPVLARESEMEQMVQILSRRKKNNPVLVGEPGVGKTVLVEGLAQRIIDRRVPKGLWGKRIIALDLAGMLAGTRFRGDFEERIKAFLSQAAQAQNVILFLDELHTLVGAGGGDGAMDAANILKPVLARGELQIVGATTPGEYTRYIEKDSALERRFQPVQVEEPSQEDTLQILKGLQPQYERFHGLSITEDALRAAVTLSSRYIGDRYLPDKAIDLVDEAAARVHAKNTSVPPLLEPVDEEIRTVCQAKKTAAESQNYEEAARMKQQEIQLRTQYDEQYDIWLKEQENRVTAQDIAQVVSTWTKIPVTALTQDEQLRLKELEQTLHRRIIGQEQAVSAVARAIRRSRTGVAEPGRPIASFLFLGPTGVGKTELCRALAEAMFQDENSMIRFDMSEYMEPHTVSRLIGSPPGYVGHDEGGQLTDQVRRKPYSIILLDEIEKANRDVWNILLQIMDDGRLTDAKGRTVDFKNTILIMTSNLGARDIAGKKPFGFAPVGAQADRPAQAEIRADVMKAVKQAFPPEFVNRLDDVIVFHALEQSHIRTIAANLTDRLALRLKEQRLYLTVEESALDVLARKGFDPVYGARPLRRTIQTMLEDKISDFILEQGVPEQLSITAVGIEDEIELKATDAADPISQTA